VSPVPRDDTTCLVEYSGTRVRSSRVESSRAREPLLTLPQFYHRKLQLRKTKHAA
jgi:hypothetical protein